MSEARGCRELCLCEGVGDTLFPQSQSIGIRWGMLAPGSPIWGLWVGPGLSYSIRDYR